MYKDLRMNFWWHGMKRKHREECGCMPGLPAGEGRASASRRVATTTTDSRVEVAARDDGFCDWPAPEYAG